MPTGKAIDVRHALDSVLKLHDHTLAAELGSTESKVVRAEMIRPGLVAAPPSSVGSGRSAG